MSTSVDRINQQTSSDAAQNQTDGLVNGIESHGDRKNSIARVQSIPVVQETLERLFAIIKANNFLALLYSKTEKLAVALYARAEPLIQSQLILADTYANKGLDMVEHRYPSVFQAKSEDIINTAKRPAQDALELFHVRLQSAQNSLVALQDQVSTQVNGVASKLPKNSTDAQKAVADLQTQLAELQKTATVQLKDLPKNAQGVVNPLLEHLQTGMNDIQAELKKTDLPVQERARNVYGYAQENLGPVINQTLENLKSLIVAKKEQAQEQASS